MIWVYSTGVVTTGNRVTNSLEQLAKWQPFNLLDSQLLSGDEREVAVLNRTMLVDERRSWMKPIYWDGPARVVCRAAWTLTPHNDPSPKDLFVLPSEYDTLVTGIFDEQHDWLKVSTDHVVEKIFKLDGDWCLVLRKGKTDQGRIVKSASLEPVLQATPSPTRKPLPFFTVKRAPSLDPTKHAPYVIPEVLVMVTHGIGQKLAAKLGYDFATDVIHFADLINSPSMAILPVVWRNELDSQYTVDNVNAFDEMMNELAVPNLPAMRSTAQHLMLDILFYATPPHSARILEIMANELNRVHGLFKKYNPEFRGTVSLVGHSLGAALVSDILAVYSPPRDLPRPPLDFEVDKVFCVGSPYPVFLLLRHARPIGCRASALIPQYQSHATPLLSSTVHFDCNGWYNIFTSFDPVAHRIEPLLHGVIINDIPVTAESPLELPSQHALARFKRNLVRSIEEVRSSISLRFSSMPDLTAFPVSPLSARGSKQSPLHAFNQMGRVDFEISRGPLEMSQYLSAMTAHISYWGSDELATFIRQEVLNGSNKGSV